jgi:ribosome biogenesis protein MAK21
MLNALLTGVNRAYKYAKMNHEEIDKNLNTLFKLVHVTSFNVSIQALMLLNQVIESREDMVNRYFNALYRRMFDLEWRNTAKQTYFLNLLYNSLIKDESLPRIKAFVKRLLQICFSQNVPFVCGSFMLISELLKVKKNIFQLDHSQLAKNAITATSNDGNKFEDDDEEEKFIDVKDESDNEAINNGSHDEIDEENEDSTNLKRKKSTSWVHKSNMVFKRHDKYDYKERNPLYCGADKTLTYELHLFTRHYHPTVVVFANKLINVRIMIIFKYHLLSIYKYQNRNQEK